VAYTDIVAGSPVLLTSPTSANITAVARRRPSLPPASGDRINVELSVEPAAPARSHDQRSQLQRQYVFDVSYITSGGRQYVGRRRVTKKSWDHRRTETLLLVRERHPPVHR